MSAFFAPTFLRGARPLRWLRLIERGPLDLLLAGVIVVLVGFGLVAVYSSSFGPGLDEHNNPLKPVERQFLFALVGLIAMFAISRLRYQALRGAAFALHMVSLALVVLTFTDVARGEAYGAARWLRLGALSFQPSELLKLSVCLYASSWFAAQPNLASNWRKAALVLGWTVGLPALLVLAQRDLGTSLVILVIGVVVYFTAGAPLRVFAVAIPALAAVLGLVVFAEPYRMSRVFAFLDPFSDENIQAGGYQLAQSLIAIGNGGLFGVGLGSSRQKFAYVFGANNDSIYAIIVEELGLVGGAFLVCLLCFAVYRGLRIASRAPDRFGALLATGITAWIGSQAFMNLGGVTQSIPWTGIPLPFISAGGTSLLVLLAAVGCVLAVSRQAEAVADPTERETRSPAARSA